MLYHGNVQIMVMSKQLLWYNVQKNIGYYGT